MNKWSNLPNAKHIDWIIQSVKDNPIEWAAAYNAARDAAWDAARNAATGAARVEVWHATKKATINAARGAAWDAARYAAYNTARDAVVALIAYDDCAKYLSMSYEELKAIADTTKIPAAILLLPAVKAKELIATKAKPTVATYEGMIVEVDGIKYRWTAVI